MGAGAVGGFFGGLLSCAGHAVAVHEMAGLALKPYLHGAPAPLASR